MSTADIASAVVFAGSVVYVIASARKRATTGRLLFRSIAALTVVAFVTAAIAVNGALTTTLFVELTACMLLFAAILHAFAWSRWLTK